jgi:hypothetical protein
MISVVMCTVPLDISRNVHNVYDHPHPMPYAIPYTHYTYKPMQPMWGMWRGALWSTSQTVLL